MDINNLIRKSKRFAKEALQRIRRLPARIKESLSGVSHLIRTGESKKFHDIRRYAEETNVIPSIHPDDLIFRFILKYPGFETREEAIRYYFQDGANSARELSELLFSKLNLRRIPDMSLLEFASGYGCVTRHLAGHLAPLSFVSCDIHREACNFINREIGIRAIPSSTSPESLDIDSESFDVVFALSFFSHMPDRTWGRWLRSLFDKVKPGGYLIFTTHGMTTWKNIGQPPVSDRGIWFAPSSEQKDLDVADYGCTIVTPEYVKRAIADELHQNALLMIEAAWWGHQDLYVVRKPTSSEIGRGNLAMPAPTAI